MDIIKVRITSANDINTLLGIVESTDPYKLRLHTLERSLLKDAIRIQLQWNENHQISEVDVVCEGVEEGVYLFKKVSSVRNGLERDFYRIDFKGGYRVKPINDENRTDISRLLTKNTGLIKSSLANKIKQVIPHESSSNQHILRFLLEIDTKLNLVLENLADHKEDVSYTDVTAIDISGGGLCFFSTEEYQDSSRVYVEGLLDDTTNKVEFVSVGKILNVLKTDVGFIYSLEFENLDTEFSDSIIKYVFEKERVMIQDLKNK